MTKNTSKRLSDFFLLPRRHSHEKEGQHAAKTATDEHISLAVGRITNVAAGLKAVLCASIRGIVAWDQQFGVQMNWP